MIKLVAFDLDGTIGDTIPMCLKALKKAVTPYVTRIGLKETKWARKTTELSAYFVTFTYSLKRYSINELSSSSILGMIYE